PTCPSETDCISSTVMLAVPAARCPLPAVSPVTTLLLFFLIETGTPDISTLSLHDALPICAITAWTRSRPATSCSSVGRRGTGCGDRKSTRLNSSHVAISYAVFCLKKKKRETLLSVKSAELIITEQLPHEKAHWPIR